MLVAGAETAAEPESSPTAARPSRQVELAAVRAEMSRLQSELEALSSERDAADRELRRVGLELEMQTARWREAQAARFLAEQALVAAAAEVERLEGEVGDAKAALRARLGALYRVGRNGELRMLLAVGSRDGLLPGARTLRYLARRDSESLAALREAERRLAEEQRTLEARRSESADWERLEEERWQALGAVEKRLGRQVAGLERRERATRAERAGLAERAARLNDLLEYLAGVPGGGAAGGDLLVDVRPMGDFEGSLDWPVQGRVRQGFGPVLDRRYGTQVPHDGVEIELDRSQVVAAVYPGEVLFAAPLDGYGLTVVLRHPGRVFSLYAGLDALRVERSGVVSLETAVGTSSDRLYFEIRVENRPVDPIPWFR